MQLFIGAADGLEGDDFERQLYVIRKRASHQLRFDESMEERLLFYICSLSTKVMIYKGMLNTEQVLKYYTDLARDDFATHTGDGAFALLDEHLSELGPRAAVPVHEPQRRDQHAARQRERHALAAGHVGERFARG